MPRLYFSNNFIPPLYRGTPMYTTNARFVEISTHVRNSGGQDYPQPYLGLHHYVVMGLTPQNLHRFVRPCGCTAALTTDNLTTTYYMALRDEKLGSSRHSKLSYLRKSERVTTRESVYLRCCKGQKARGTMELDNRHDLLNDTSSGNTTKQTMALQKVMTQTRHGAKTPERYEPRLAFLLFSSLA